MLGSMESHFCDLLGLHRRIWVTPIIPGGSQTTRIESKQNETARGFSSGQSHDHGDKGEKKPRLAMEYFTTVL